MIVHKALRTRETHIRVLFFNTFFTGNAGEWRGRIYLNNLGNVYVKCRLCR